MQQAYCPQCGIKLRKKFLENEGQVPYCDQCKDYRFPFFNTAISMIVVNQQTDEILLIQQYGRKKNILVAGYLYQGENLETAVKRELAEETGLTPTVIHFNRSKFYQPSNTLMCNFTVVVNGLEDFKVNNEVDRYAWFSRSKAQEAIWPGSLAEEFLLAYLNEKN